MQVGRSCWVGPYTVLDGSHAPLTIGDYVDIGSGAHVYTHNTIERALTGHKAPLFGNATTIGNCCFIAPACASSPRGTVLGRPLLRGRRQLRRGDLPHPQLHRRLPAQRVGVVEIRGDHARLRRTETPGPGTP